MSIVSRSSRMMFALVLTGLALATGCATSSHETGRVLADDKVSQIVDGQTTLPQVVAMFGAPTTQTPIGKHVLYIYRHTVIKGSTAFLPYFTHGESKESSDELTVTFDENERVVAHSVQRGIDGGASK